MATVSSVNTSVAMHFLRFMAVVAASLFFIPGQFFGVVGSGLDPSWQVALHEAIESGRIFGRDFVFAYGPLGWISTRLPYPTTTSYLLMVDILTMGMLIVALALLAGSCTKWYHLLALPVVCWAAGTPFLAHNFVMFVFALESIFLLYYLTTGSKSILILSAILSVVTFFIKLNVGFAGLGAFGLTLLFRLSDRRKEVLSLVGWAGFLLALLVASCACLRVDLLGYIKGSLAIAAGYNEAMMLPPAGRETYLWSALSVVAVVALWMGINLGRMYRHGVALCATLLNALFLFLLFKQSFVRADEHVLEFVAWGAVPVGILVWATRSVARWGAVPLIVSLLPPVFLGEPSHLNFDYVSGRVSYFSRYWHELSHRQDLSTRSALRPDAYLPQDMLEKIGTETVDVFPWEISSVIASGLKYHPRPVMQSYASYTEYLDSLNGDFLNSSARPEYLIYAHHCADGRYCNFDDTQSRLAILAHYDVVGRWPYQLLLKAREIPRKVEREIGPSESLVFGKSAHIPTVESDELLIAKVHVTFTPLGKLLSVLYQPATVEIVLYGKGVRTKPYRAVPSILRGGVILNRLVESVDDAESLFRHEPTERCVTKIKLASSRPTLYGSQISVNTERVRFR